ncbi:MAG: hypothetical protein WCI75_09340, partial [candidate division NC10 bacterium]
MVHRRQRVVHGAMAAAGAYAYKGPKLLTLDQHLDGLVRRLKVEPRPDALMFDELGWYEMAPNHVVL